MEVSPAVRQTFDQTFMELLAAVRVEVLDAKPPAMAQNSQVAMMFFKESQKSVLQELAVLTAAWNDAKVDLESVDRATRTLEGMGLSGAKKRLQKLHELEAQG
jgi:hypothetical protein